MVELEGKIYQWECTTNKKRIGSDLVISTSFPILSQCYDNIAL